jgi:hypothetical protein
MTDPVDTGRPWKKILSGDKGEGNSPVAFVRVPVSIMAGCRVAVEGVSSIAVTG